MNPFDLVPDKTREWLHDPEKAAALGRLAAFLSACAAAGFVISKEMLDRAENERASKKVKANETATPDIDD